MLPYDTEYVTNLARSLVIADTNTRRLGCGKSMERQQIRVDAYGVCLELRRKAEQLFSEMEFLLTSLLFFCTS